MNCALQTCGREAAELVAHPRRPEPRTPLCDHHAGVVHDALDAEVIGGV